MIPSRVQALFDDGVVTAELALDDAALDGSDPIDPLLAGVAHLFADAVPKRRRELVAGRRAAAAAIGALVGSSPGVGVGPRGEPLWPAGVVGSLSHAAGLCVAVVAPAVRVAALGVDVETAAPLDEASWDAVCTPAELAWLGGRAPGARGALAKLLFSAKEAFYKAQAPTSGVLLDFLDVELAVDLLDDLLDDVLDDVRDDVLADVLAVERAVEPAPARIVPGAGAPSILPLRLLRGAGPLAPGTVLRAAALRVPGPGSADLWATAVSVAAPPPWR